MSKSKVSLASRIRPRGEVQLDVRDASGALVQSMVVRNTITYDGLNAFLWRIHKPTADHYIDRLIPGTGPTPPSKGDIAMVAPLGSSDQVPLTDPNFDMSEATGELVISATLDLTQGNGQTLREVGLRLHTGQLFARQVHPGVPKSGLVTVTYTWRIASTS